MEEVDCTDVSATVGEDSPDTRTSLRAADGSSDTASSDGKDGDGGVPRALLSSTKTNRSDDSRNKLKANNRREGEQAAPKSPTAPAQTPGTAELDKTKRRRISVNVKQETSPPPDAAAARDVARAPVPSQKRAQYPAAVPEQREKKDGVRDDRKEDRRDRRDDREPRRDRDDRTLERMPPPLSSSNSQRGFAGFIFGCTVQTFDECMDLSILAGPRQMMREVLQITPYDTPLFLFHITHRTMYGVFEATSAGAENLIPHAFQAVSRSPNPFPAQVSFRFKYQFLPLPESKFGHLLNYHHNKPAASLSKEHVRLLMNAFAENDASTAMRARDQLLQFFKL